MCVACGIDSGPSFFCQPCWRATPLALKQDWWMWTKYGSVAPTDEEIAVFVEKRKAAVVEGHPA